MSSQHLNEVALVGKLSKEPAVKPLPSGRTALEWRLVVLRPRDGQASRPGAHDTIDCVSYVEEIQRAATEWQKGDLIAVRGALRRHFWESTASGSRASRYDVEVWEALPLIPATLLDLADPADP